jgi:hypothetical protein
MMSAVKLRILLLGVSMYCVALPAIGFAASSPRGTFTTHLAGASPQFLNGEWKVEFASAGKLTIRHSGEIAARGTYAAVGAGRLQIEDRSGPVSCTTPEDSGPAVYRWHMRAHKLVLTAIHDRCGGRKTVLTAHPLKLTG